jgi:hypothetical protein
MVKNVEKKKLTTRQIKMIAALLSSQTIGEACQIVGVTRTTLTRWLSDPMFTAALSAAEGDSINTSSRSFLAGQEEARETIREIMTSGQNDAVRLKAANDWLNLLFKYREVDQLEERISKLEQRNK